MYNEKAKIIEKLIQCKEAIDNLEPNKDKCDSAMVIYNRKIIEKAVLTQELKNYNDNLFLKIVKKIVPNQEKMISDYFN